MGPKAGLIPGGEYPRGEGPDGRASGGASVLAGSPGHLDLDEFTDSGGVTRRDFNRYGLFTASGKNCNSFYVAVEGREVGRCDSRNRHEDCLIHVHCVS